MLDKKCQVVQQIDTSQYTLDLAEIFRNFVYIDFYF